MSQGKGPLGYETQACSSTCQTVIDLISKSEVRFAGATARALSRRIHGMHGNERSSGACCLAGDQFRELAQHDIVNTLRRGMVLAHVRDRQIFDSDQIESID